MTVDGAGSVVAGPPATAVNRSFLIDRSGRRPISARLRVACRWVRTSCSRPSVRLCSPGGWTTSRCGASAVLGCARRGPLWRSPSKAGSSSMSSRTSRRQ